MLSNLSKSSGRTRCRLNLCALCLFLGVPPNRVLADHENLPPMDSTHHVTFATSGQNMWGPAGTTPPRAQFDIVNVPWNQSGSVGNVFGLGPFGDFGARINGATSGRIRVSFVLEDMANGLIGVNYPVAVTLHSPAVDSYRGGDVVRVTADYTVLPGANLYSAPSTGRIAMHGQTDFAANANADICLFGCQNFSFFPPLNLHPGNFNILTIPSSLEGVNAGPWRTEVARHLGTQNCPGDQVTVSSDSAVADQTGVSGCFGFPEIQTASAVGPNGKSLHATGSDQFLKINLDLDNWFSKIPGVPPFGVSIPDAGHGVSAGADILNVALDNDFTLSQHLILDANIRVTLEFPEPVSYTVTPPHGAPRSGFSGQVTFDVGEALDFVAPDSVISATPTLSLPHSFSNNTNLTYELHYLEEVAKLGINMPGFNLTPEICPCCYCSFTGCGCGCCCCSLDFPGVNLQLGPLFSYNPPITTQTDSTLFDRNRPPWQLTGFNPQTVSPFALDPEFQPVAVIDVAVGPFNEGEPVIFSAANSTDADNDPLSFTWDFGDGGTGKGPTTGETVTHYFGDNGTYTVTLTADDGHEMPGVTQVHVTILNVDPALSDFADRTEDEGTVVDVSVTLTDPGFLDTFTTTFDWGDNTPSDLASWTPVTDPIDPIVPRDNRTVSGNHVYADNGVYTLTICTEDDDGAGDCGTLDITVENVVPTIAIQAAELQQRVLNLGEEIEITARFRAPYTDMGTLDTHVNCNLAASPDADCDPLDLANARVDWADGNTEDLIPFTEVTESPFGPPGSKFGNNGRVLTDRSHIYSARNTYPVNICVRDDDDEEACATSGDLLVDIRESDLRLTRIVEPTPPGPVPVGTEVTYTFTVINDGPDSVEDVRLTDMLPRLDGTLVTELVSAKRGGGSAAETRLLGTDSPAIAEEGFGGSVALEGDRLVVGSEGYGDVYVFQRTGSTWSRQAILQDSDPTDGLANNGRTVAISGDTIIVGSPRNDEACDASVGVSCNAGAAFIFQFDGAAWTQQARIIGSDVAQYDNFGWDVAISENIAVVSAPFHDASKGAVYVFERTGDTWSQVAKLADENATVDASFGNDVAISGDSIAVTVPGRSFQGMPGSISVYTKNAGAWTLESRLTDADAGESLDTFGSGVDIDGDLLVVGSVSTGSHAGAAHVFKRNASTWSLEERLTSPEASIYDSFGDSTAINGNRLVIAAPDDETAHVFERNGTTWTLVSQLTTSDPSFYKFGSAVDVDGETLVSGAPYFFSVLYPFSIGATYVFEICPEFPPGTVTCSLGTIESGGMGTVEIIARVGCALDGAPFAPSDLVNEARVFGLALDPDRSNNVVTDSLSTTSPPQDVCGVDLTPPSITPIVSGTIGDNGWYTSDVTVDWIVVDPDSPITGTIGCDSSMVITDTTGTTFTCNATHTAGNGGMLSASNNVTIKRDATPPIVAPVLAGTLGNNGWYLSDVDVSFECTDSMSGVDNCTNALSLSSDGEHPSILGEARDAAGNTATVHSGNIKIDQMPPTIVAGRTPANVNGWNNSEVTVRFTCSDSGSGLADCSSDVVLANEGMNQSASGTASDHAGNTAAASLEGINIDKTPPAITAASAPSANAGGWNNTTVVVHFLCDDSLSGVGDCVGDAILIGEGASQFVPGVATDLAGNAANTSVNVNIDMTPPMISAIVSPQPNGDGLYNSPVNVAFSCSDALSGMASCEPSIALNNLGPNQTADGAASDQAGNIASASTEKLNIGIPTLVLHSISPTVEGATVELSATLDAVAMTNGPATIDWGDGSDPTPAESLVSGNQAHLIGNHVYADDGTYTVTVVAPAHAGPFAVDTVDVSVENAGPELLAIEAPANAVVGEPVLVTGSFRDFGSADVHTATVDWNDGTPVEDAFVVEAPFGPPGNATGMLGSLSAKHTYGAVGTYFGEVCVLDDEDAGYCLPLAIDVAPAPLVGDLECSIEVDAIHMQGSDTLFELAGIVTDVGTLPLSATWGSSHAGATFDDSGSLMPILTIDESADPLAGMFSVVFRVTAMVGGEAVYCDATLCADLDVGATLAACPSLNPCEPDPCENGGTCTVTGNTFICECEDGYAGDHCETPVCFGQTGDLACGSGHGTCIAPDTCRCNPNWIGSACELRLEQRRNAR